MADVVQVVGTDDPVRPLFSATGELKADARSGLNLDAAALRGLYQQMVLIRRADAEALNLQRQGELGLWGQYLGQEAIHVGAVAALESDDWIFPSYRESLSPLDMPTILASLQKTHRAIVVHEAPVFGGFGAEIAARISDDGFDLLQAPVARVGGMNTPYPPSRFRNRRRDPSPSVPRATAFPASGSMATMSWPCLRR
ncbi:MAG: hypothetical protein E6I07_09290 [Chloroflexi bacterium]|nr:MAG: hypothetical protein E6I07_09290 [Chloroflexota bacterium]